MFVVLLNILKLVFNPSKYFCQRIILLNFFIHTDWINDGFNDRLLVNDWIRDIFNNDFKNIYIYMDNFFLKETWFKKNI